MTWPAHVGVDPIAFSGAKELVSDEEVFGVSGHFVAY